MVRQLALALVLVLLLGGTGMAATFDFSSGNTSLSTLGQEGFRSLSKELGIALAYRNAAPPHPLGVTGFDAGIEVEAVDISKESAFWKKAFNQDAPGYLVLPKLRVRKGLPFGIDVGAMYSNVGNTNVQLYGAEVGMALLEGGVATPALGVRATYTRLAGIKELDLQTVGVDASIGKGFLFLTPYAGAGYVWIDSTPKGNLSTLGLKEEKISQPRFFAGLEVKPLPLVRIVGEFEYALRPIYTLKAAVGF